MKIKTNELIGPALDWLVAKCEGQPVHWHEEDQALYCGEGPSGDCGYTPSTEPAQAHLIIFREEIGFAKYGPNGSWKAVIGETPRGSPFYGPTPLIAAMRCYVASKLGNVVEIPEELE